MLKEDLEKELESDFRKYEGLDDRRKELMIHEEHFAAKEMNFCVRKELCDKLLTHAEEQMVTIIKGERGSGKSTLIAAAAKRLRDEKGWNVFMLESGLTRKTDTALEIVKHINYRLESEMGFTHSEDGEEQEDILQLCKRLDILCFFYSHIDKKLAVMIDAIDQLTADSVRDKLMFIPTYLAKNIHFVITCTSEIKTSLYKSFVLPNISGGEKDVLIESVFREISKEIPKELKSKLKERSSSGNPLYLRLAAQRLNLMNREDYLLCEGSGDYKSRLLERMSQILDNCPDDPDEMAVELLTSIGKLIGNNIVMQLGKYIAVSRRGMRKDELADLIGEDWQELDFVRLINFTNGLFMIRSDGRYDFHHSSISSGFMKLCGDPRDIHGELFEYLKERECKGLNDSGDIIYHAINSENYLFVSQYIAANHSDKGKLKAAAHIFFDKCTIDGCDWLGELFEEAYRSDSAENLCLLFGFADNELFRELSSNNVESPEFLRTLASILEISAHYAERLEKRNPFEVCEAALAENCLRLGEVLLKLAKQDKSNFVRAAELFEKSERILTRLYEKQHSTEVQNRLMIVKKKRIVVQLNSTELSAEELKKSLNDALLCMKFENSLEKESNDSQDIQRRLADTCELLGDIYFEIWKKSDSLREESVFSDLEDDCELETEFLYYYGKSIHIWEKLQNNYGNVLDGMELIRVYEKESKLTSGMYGSGFAKTEKIIPVYKRLFQNSFVRPSLWTLF